MTYRSWNCRGTLQQLLNCGAIDRIREVVNGVSCFLHSISRIYAIFLDLSLHICNESKLIKLGIGH